MTLRTLPWALALTLLPGLALAQDLNGSYELEGRYSNRRATAVELTISKSSSGWWSVRRTGRYTSARHSSKPAFSWHSSSVRVQGRALHVRFDLDGPGHLDAMGALGHLDPDSSSRDDVLDALAPKNNSFRAVYFLSSDGKRLSEYVVNQTRQGEHRWWRWITTSGDKLAAPSVTPFTPAEFEASALATMKDWYTEWVEETYDEELADAAGDAALIAELNADKAIDLDFSNVTVHDGEPYFDYYGEWVDDQYASGSPLLDRNGNPIPQAALKIKTLDMFPEFAGIGLNKVFLFDSRTGEVVESSEIID